VPQTHTDTPLSDAKEFFMKRARYAVFEALNPFFEIVLRGLSGLVDGEHYFDTFANDAVFESRYHFPGWPVTIRGRANLMASLAGYGKTIKLKPAMHLLYIEPRIVASSSSNTECTGRFLQVEHPMTTD
jgi:ketosteroid isomerase-like protein